MTHNGQYFQCAETSTRIRVAIQEWFVQNAMRPLPWRSEPKAANGLPMLSHASAASPRRDPYATWVCEVMSQQTRIQTVIPYWTAWMKRFPDVSSLASADSDTVRAMWAGLGFYRRAALLHQGAQYVQTQCGGRMPTAEAELRKVPGIGPYTAGAIASICYDEPVAAIDGNVLRVLSRLSGDKDFDPKDARDCKRAAQWGVGLYSSCEPGPQLPGYINEGLIELGATLCRPSGEPSCSECPLSNLCKARQFKDIGDIECIDGIIPKRGKKIANISSQHVMTFVHAFFDGTTPEDFHIILAKRKADGLLANMWEFPNIQLQSPEDKREQAAAVKALQTLDAATPKRGNDCTKPISSAPLKSFVHKFSHINMTIEPHLVLHASLESLQALCKGRSGPHFPQSRDVRVVSTADIATLGAGKIVEKVVSQVRQSHASTGGSVTGRKRPRCASP